MPLAEELKSSAAIAIGTVLRVQALSEDQSEPEFPTAYIYTVHVSRLLKGALPRNIQLRAENDSGGYRMTVGERHILFLQKEGDHFIADDCGNSAVLPQGNEILRKTEEELSGGSNVP